MNKKILVTGGLGYIGSHTTVELLQNSYEVIVIDNLSNSEAWIKDRIELICNKKIDVENIDLQDREKVFDFFDRHTDITGVIHFAAYKAVGESVADSLKYYRNNICSLIYLLEAMNRYDVNNLVFSSSCTVYGQPDTLPITEDTPLQEARSPYGNTKQISEEIIRDAITSYKKLNAIFLRYFNPIGAHPSALIGELPLGVPNNLIPFITQTAIGKREVLRVFGKDYNTHDGTCIRDYIDITDLAKAHIASLNRMLLNKMQAPNEIFNVGTGKGSSVLDVIKTFEQVTGVKLNYEFADRRSGDTEKIWADTTRANAILQWKTEVSLEQSLANAWEWEKKLVEM
ncbi:MAG: UDP-glucose 4-epimerase GalE [Bacteroidales bacterium]